MSEIVSFDAGDGEVLVEVDPIPYLSKGEDEEGLQRAGLREKFSKAPKSFDESLEPALEHVAKAFKSVGKLKPDSIEVEFGFKLSGSAGAIITKASGEANFAVKLTWQPEKPTEEQPDAPAL